MFVIVALTERYKKLQDRVVDKSLPVPVMTTIASLEFWLNEAERVLTSHQNTAPGSIAQLESAIRQHRVCAFSTYFCFHLCLTYYGVTPGWAKSQKLNL